MRTRVRTARIWRDKMRRARLRSSGCGGYGYWRDSLRRARVKRARGQEGVSINPRVSRVTAPG